jgi:dTDP-4-dehydrorhamnose 3,5-epimerase
MPDMVTGLHSPVAVPVGIRPKRHADNRGWFSEVFHSGKLRDRGITCEFVQDNQSSSTRIGTLRGLHFQRPPAAQAKLVSVLRGRVLDVSVDIRRGSPSFGKYVSVELSAADGFQVYVPVGFAHGFISLEDNVLVAYKASDFYSPAHDAGLRWNDPDIAIAWPFSDADILKSPKDGELPFLKEFESPFSYDGHPLTALKFIDLS